MTTVTEAAKRVIGGEEPDSGLQGNDLSRFLSDPVLAHRFARRLAEVAREVAPGRPWSVEDLRDVFDAAVKGPPAERGRLIEGRHLRKRLREQVAFCERYGDSFAFVIARLAPESQPGTYAAALDRVVERLRCTDMVFLYRRRYAAILPRMRREALGAFLERMRALITQSAGAHVVESIDALEFPDPAVPDTQTVLDWAEDQLREQ